MLSSCGIGWCRVVFRCGPLWSRRVGCLVWRLNRWHRCLGNSNSSASSWCISSKCSNRVWKCRDKLRWKLSPILALRKLPRRRTMPDKTFSKMKGDKVTRNLGRIGGTSFVSRLRGVSAKRLRSWVGLRTDTISRFLSLTSNKLHQRRIGLTWQMSTCSFTVIWFLSWKSALRVSKLCVTPRLEWGLDAWRRMNHKYDPRNPLRNIQLLERFARAVASWLFKRSCKHGETRARAASGSP